MAFETTKQHQIFENHGKYIVKSDLVATCMGSNLQTQYNEEYVFQGFGYCKDVGYALLSFLAFKALDIERVPFCYERILHGPMNFHRRSVYEEHLSKLDSETMPVVLQEVIAIYEHTQRSLSSMGLDKVSIIRNIEVDFTARDVNARKYTLGFYNYVRAHKVLGLPSVPIDMDSLNSFTDSNQEYSGQGDIALRMMVNARDVFYCSALVDSHYADTDFIEPNEWVVINRSPTGVVSIPTDDIEIRENRFSWVGALSEVEAQDIIDTYSPYRVRDLQLKKSEVPDPEVKYNWKARLALWLLK
ncbi:hypothetical protein [Vibrio agarivorans]|uniref:Uncharacterized protein n=1 Tax=Vibrio agarivorans TaxID=153622 RepID=A0ABT7Y759_9VIBR|nr:hypothetical protein [Vibrio agarivorans]MDN2483864.1 hypothetical protein [Vibrio agarivorans]